jgi:hypothetical protein
VRAFNLAFARFERGETPSPADAEPGLRKPGIDPGAIPAPMAYSGHLPNTSEGRAVSINIGRVKRDARGAAGRIFSSADRVASAAPLLLRRRCRF